MDISSFLKRLPKAELHVHVEGTLEPDMLFELARRNDVALPWPDPESLRQAYAFENLEHFLELYFAGCRVLRRERDFHDVTYAYLARAHEDGIIRAEMFLGPQSFTSAGVPIEDIMGGVLSAVDRASRNLGIDGALLVSAHRHRHVQEALNMMDSVMPWADSIAGFGLGGAERNNPPAPFKTYFDTCRARGFRTTAHAGEEGPSAYVRDAVEVLDVDRIDHGTACMADEDLVDLLVRRQIPLTVCPLSNLRLNGVPSLDVHPLGRMLDAGLCVTINSDDPSYFGGYVLDNYLAVHRELALSGEQLVVLARNSIRAAFMPPAGIADGLRRIDAYLASIPPLA